ncbi:endo-beta-N-acetylglucosaminidase [Kitasatospora sp. HPMI-4]|uniref:endo-beta-N-acetylglucosaminidase n=1 Tax=Kitasatospora sp. HPMI-4 TaxID=3448443 RepID=UPI003F1C918A
MRLRHLSLLLCAALATTVLGTVPATAAAPDQDRAAATATAEATADSLPRTATTNGSQPYASHWYPNTILDWDPATDPDARFNRSRVPLQPRTTDPALRANPNARAGEAKISSLVSFGPTSANPSQGSADPDYYAFGYWQYVNTLVFWGGSASEGLILAPNPTVIDAAHRNGVKVYGTVFFPPAAYGGQLQWVRDFVRKSGSRYPVADKLVQVAKYYGFDGWFVNQETGGGDSALATELRDTMTYARAQGRIEFQWYDAMTASGDVGWQEQLDSANSAFLQDGAKRVADSMFLDFGWTAAGLDSSRSVARSLGRSEYDLYSGIDTEADGYRTGVSWDALFPPGKPQVTSVGLYRPEWTWKSAGDRADFYARESRYWVGANGDPSDTTTPDSWKGLADYIAESSPVTAKPFVTSFDTGQGDFYNSGGKRVASGGWNNLSLQDVLPTYRWLVASNGSRLSPSIDFTDAYEGGSSLRLTGRLDAVNTIRLYESRLPVTAATRLSVVLRTPAAGDSHLSAAVSFTDDPTRFTTIPLGATHGSGWERRTLDLSGYKGRTIAQIGLRVAAPSPVASYDVRIGQLAVYDGPVSATAAPTALTVLGATDVSATRKSLRLSWSAPKAGAVHHYEVYRCDPDGSRTFLGGTPDDAYFVPRLDRFGTESTTTIEVQAVSTTYGRSTVATARISWAGAPPVGSAPAPDRPAPAARDLDARGS